MKAKCASCRNNSARLELYRPLDPPGLVYLRWACLCGWRSPLTPLPPGLLSVPLGP